MNILKLLGVYCYAISMLKVSDYSVHGTYVMCLGWLRCEVFYGYVTFL